MSDLSVLVLQGSEAGEHQRLEYDERAGVFRVVNFLSAVYTWYPRDYDELVTILAGGAP